MLPACIHILMQLTKFREHPVTFMEVVGNLIKHVKKIKLFNKVAFKKSKNDIFSKSTFLQLLNVFMGMNTIRIEQKT